MSYFDERVYEAAAQPEERKQVEIYTEREAAEIIGIAEVTLRKLRRLGRASYARIGRLIRYTPEHIEETMRLNTIRPRTRR